MAAAFAAPVEPCGVTEVEPLHSRAEIGLRGLGEEMVMVIHMKTFYAFAFVFILASKASGFMSKVELRPDNMTRQTVGFDISVKTTNAAFQFTVTVTNKSEKIELTKVLILPSPSSQTIPVNETRESNSIAYKFTITTNQLQTVFQFWNARELGGLPSGSGTIWWFKAGNFITNQTMVLPKRPGPR